MRVASGYHSVRTWASARPPRQRANFMQQSQPTQQESEVPGSREAALSEVLSSYVEPRAVSYRFVVAFALLGLLGCISLAWAASRVPSHPPVRFELGGSELMARGVAAYNRGDWDEAEKLLSRAAASAPELQARLADYAVRLSLIRRDGERLARAEEALEGDDPERALEQLAAIGANSPLFAQAEVLGRAARAQADTAALARQAAELEAEAERQASGAAMARTFAPAPEAPPARTVTRRRGVARGRAPTHTGDEAW